MLDPIQYEFRFLQNTLVDPEPGLEPEPKLRYSGSSSSQKFWLHAAPAPAPQHCFLAKYESKIFVPDSDSDPIPSSNL
jgi:hypothetical protein